MLTSLYQCFLHARYCSTPHALVSSLMFTAALQSRHCGQASFICDVESLAWGHRAKRRHSRSLNPRSLVAETADHNPARPFMDPARHLAVFPHPLSVFLLHCLSGPCYFLHLQPKLSIDSIPCPLSVHFANRRWLNLLTAPFSGFHLPTLIKRVLLSDSSHIICCCSASELCLIPCNSMDGSLPGSSVHGILQARILEQVAVSISRGSSQLRDRTQVSCTGQWILYC